MKLTKDSIIEFTQDVENTRADRRQKCWTKAPVFKAGLRVVHRLHHNSLDGESEWYTLDGKRGSLDRWQTEFIFDHHGASVRLVPESEYTLDDWLLSRGYSSIDITKHMIHHMLEEGFLSVKSLDNLASQIEAKWDAEDGEEA